MIAVLLALTVLLLFLGAGFAMRQGRCPAWVIAAIALGPPLMVLWSLLEADFFSHRFGDLRLTLLAVRADISAMHEGVSIGGGDDDLVRITRLPSGLVQLKATDDDNIEIWTTLPERAANAGVVSLEPDPKGPVDKIKFFFSPKPLAGERNAPPSLATGPQCDLSIGQGSLINTAAAGRLPSFASWRLNTPAATDRIYALRTFGTPIGSTTDVASGGGGVASGCATQLLGQNNEAPAAAFIYRSGGVLDRLWLGGQWRVMFLGPQRGYRVGTLTRNGEAKRLRLYRVQYADADTEADAERLERIVERRSLVLRFDDNGLTITPDTPEALDNLRADAIGEAVKQTSQGSRYADLLVSVDQDRTASRPPIGDAALAFNMLGGRFSSTVLARFSLHPTDKLGGLKPFFLRTTEIGREPTLFGQPFWTGQAVKAQMRLDRLERTAGVMAFINPILLLLAGAAAVAATWRARRDSLPALAIFAVLECLLALRLLTAISGSYVDAGADRAHVVSTALITYLATPFLMSFFLRPRPPWIGQLAHGGLALAAGALIVTRYDTSGFGMLMLGLTGLGWFGLLVLALLRGGGGQAWLSQQRTKARMRLAWRKARQSGQRMAGVKVLAPVRWLGRWCYRGLATFLGRWIPEQAIGLICWIVALVVGRLVLMAFGVQEGLVIPIVGVRVAVSLFYLPAAIGLLIALLFALRPTASTPPRHGRLVPALVWIGALGLVFVGAPLLVRDIGFIFFSLGVGFVALLVTTGRLPEKVPPSSILLLGGLLAGFALLQWSLLHGFVTENVGFPALLLLILPLAALIWAKRGQTGFGLAAAAVLFGLLAFLAWTIWTRTLRFDGWVVLAAAVGVSLLLLAIVRRPVFLWSAPVAAAVVLAFTLHVPGLVAAQAPTAGGTVDAQTLERLDRQTQKTQNHLRIWYNVRPQTGAEIGTSTAQDLGGALAHLKDYVACPSERWPGCLFGRGYLATPPPTVLAAYHLDDNVSAIHLISPFGRAAAFFLLALLAAAPIICGAHLTRRNDGGYAGLSRRQAMGLAALWTVFVAALYMILANLQVVPFTGKNVYFLAAESGSDLLEGMVLLVMSLVLLQEKET